MYGVLAPPIILQPLSHLFYHYSNFFVSLSPSWSPFSELGPTLNESSTLTKNPALILMNRII